MATRGPRLILVLIVTFLGLIVLTGLFAWRDDILQAFLDPRIPFSVYRPPAAPDYGMTRAWAHLPGPLKQGDAPADVFFIHPTTFDGGRGWNGGIDDRVANRRLTQTMIPNYAAPFASVGRLYIPHYRQASLYTSLSLFDDALEARIFAYRDIVEAFQSFLKRIGPDRPFLLVGVEQGGLLADHLLREEITPDPELRRRLVAAYLIETIVPAADHGPESAIPACARRKEPGCVVAWISAPELDFVVPEKIMTRGVIWSDEDRLVGLGGQEPLCVNPLLGAVGESMATARLNLGAANATGLEWGTRPGFMARQVRARCEAGILRVSRPRSAALRPTGGWPARLRAPPFNLFWADLEADSQARLNAWRSRHVGD